MRSSDARPLSAAHNPRAGSVPNPHETVQTALPEVLLGASIEGD